MMDAGLHLPAAALAAIQPGSVVLDGGQIGAVFLVLMRCTGLIVSAPILGHRATPAMVKAGLAAVLAFALAGHASVAPGALPILMAAPIELLIGLALGTIASLGFHALELAGRVLSLQMGLSLGAVLNPMSHENGTALDPFFSILAGILFLALDLHIALVGVLAHSFTVLPIGGGWPASLFQLVADLTALALELGTRLIMPLALVLLLVELAIALLARAIPQINVFFLGLPLKILAGVALLIAGLPNLVAGAGGIFRTLLASASAGAIR
jgi:flagellar biosynthetic protein FliR